MKQLTLIILILIISSASKSSLGCQYLSDKDPGSYSIEIYPDAINNVSLVKFNIPADSFVKIIIRDEFNNKTEILTDDEMDKGEYCLYFKSDQTTASNKLVCQMEVMDAARVKVIFSKEIILKQN